MLGLDRKDLSQKLLWDEEKFQSFYIGLNPRKVFKSFT